MIYETFTRTDGVKAGGNRDRRKRCGADQEKHK